MIPHDIQLTTILRITSVLCASENFASQRLMTATRTPAPCMSIRFQSVSWTPTPRCREHSSFCIYTVQHEDTCNAQRTYHATRQVFVDPLTGMQIQCSTPSFLSQKIEKRVTVTTRRTPGPRKQSRIIVVTRESMCRFHNAIYVGCIYPSSQTFARDFVYIGYPWLLDIKNRFPFIVH